jgi:hypothetical protein
MGLLGILAIVAVALILIGAVTKRLSIRDALIGLLVVAIVAVALKALGLA